MAKSKVTVPLIKKLRGRRVLVNAPIADAPKSVIELSPEVQDQIDQELMKKWTRLEVYEVGDEVTDLAKGDKVYIPSGALQNAERIVFSDTDIKFLVDDYVIGIIW